MNAGGNTDYILKHKDSEVAVFTVDEDKNIIKIINVSDKELLPVGAKLRVSDESVAAALQKWIEERGIPESREDKEELRKLAGAKDSKDMMFGAYGLSLSDCYWMHKKEAQGLQWKNVNFYENAFADIMKNGKGKNKEEGEIERKVNPNLSVNGALTKKWFINKEGKRVLAKRGRSAQDQEPFNEEIAYKVAKMYGIECVKYRAAKDEEGKNVSACLCMFDGKEELMPASFVINEEERKGRNNYELYIDVCKNKGIKDIRESVDKMIFLDYVLGNDDRHTHNFGIVRDAETLEWKKAVPLFDNGNILHYGAQEINDGMAREGVACRWFGGMKEEKLKHMEYPRWYKPGKDKEVCGIIRGVLSGNENIKEKKIKALEKIVSDRIRAFERENDIMLKVKELRMESAGKEKKKKSRGR